MEERFKIVFHGEIAADRTVDEVKQNLAKLYKSPVEKLESWFSGRAITIKAGTDRATAEKYQKIFEQAGAICAIEAEGSVEEASQAPTSSPPPPSEQPTDVEEDSAVISDQDTEIKKQPKRERSRNMDQKGFFATLFDLSFTQFITPRVVKFFYVLSIILLALATIVLVFFVLTQAPVPGSLKYAIIPLAPIVFFLFLITIRMWFELTIVFFRIEKNTRDE